MTVSIDMLALPGVTVDALFAFAAAGKSFGEPDAGRFLRWPPPPRKPRPRRASVPSAPAQPTEPEILPPEPVRPMPAQSAVVIDAEKVPDQNGARSKLGSAPS